MNISLMTTTISNFQKALKSNCVKPEESCKKCGRPLIWEDTIDHSGGIDDGYLLEHQLWSCDHCKIDYIIDKKVEFVAKGKIVYFEEA